MEEDAIAWKEALDVDIWRNYHINRLVAYQLRLLEQKNTFFGIGEKHLKEEFDKKIEEKIEEISNFILNLRRCSNKY
jgi:hypothetical protein